MTDHEHPCCADLKAELEKARNPLVTREGDTVKDFDRVIRERDAFEKLARSIADSLWSIGESFHKAQDPRGVEFKKISTNIHRGCQIIKGEEPLPAPGERLT